MISEGGLGKCGRALPEGRPRRPRELLRLARLAPAGERTAREGELTAPSSEEDLRTRPFSPRTPPPSDEPPASLCLVAPLSPPLPPKTRINFIAATSQAPCPAIHGPGHAPCLGNRLPSTSAPAPVPSAGHLGGFCLGAPLSRPLPPARSSSAPQKDPAEGESKGRGGNYTKVTFFASPLLSCPPPHRRAPVGCGAALFLC